MSESDSLRQQAVLDAQYALMQQLVPGETMQPNQLAMVIVIQYPIASYRIVIFLCLILWICLSTCVCVYVCVCVFGVDRYILNFILMLPT
jgi:hypothetical protein